MKLMPWDPMDTGLRVWLDCTQAQMWMKPILRKKEIIKNKTNPKQSEWIATWKTLDSYLHSN